MRDVSGAPCRRRAIAAVLLAVGLSVSLSAAIAPPGAWGADEVLGISANPGATNVITGTGLLGRVLGFGKDSGVHLGGVWVGDAGYLISGGAEPRTRSVNSLLLVDVSLDLEKLLRIPGAQFGVEFLQFNGEPTNAHAGAVAGYNGLPGLPPLDRAELYELWWRQRLFGDKLIIRIGKTVPTHDFNNVIRPLSLQDETLFIPAVSGLIYTPVFVNPTLLGAMPGYYNSAYGITATFTPTSNIYASYGIYDGNGARGEQTGLNLTPQFNGYYFTIGEVGYAWRLGAQGVPGAAAIGGWRQAGELSAGPVKEHGASGFYAFGSQRLWLRHPGLDNSGVSGFFQFGVNDSDTMIVNEYVGAGLTGFGLLPGRARDSMGGGVAVSWLNRIHGFRDHEVMLQAYYQMHVVGDVYVQPNVTHIPNPGASRTLAPATAVTVRLTVLF